MKSSASRRLYPPFPAAVSARYCTRRAAGICPERTAHCGWGRRGAYFFVAALVILGGGCGPAEQTGPGVDTAAETSSGAGGERTGGEASPPKSAREFKAAASVPPGSSSSESGLRPPTNPTIPLQGLQPQGDRLLAESTGPVWESERIADAAAARLKELCQRMLEGKLTDLAALCEPRAWCGPLRPLPLEVVFRDPTFTVYRPAAEDRQEEPPESDTRGRIGVSQALGALVQPLRGARQVRFEQKVIHVEVQDSRVETTSLMHFFGKTEEGNLQQNFTWLCEWNRSSDGRLTLTSMRATDYEEIHTALGQSPAFVDCTEAVLGNSPYWREILSHGTDHWLDRVETRYGMDPAGWQGIAVGDANGDGLDDLYVCQPGGIPNALLVQSPDGTVTDRAARAGVNFYDQSHAGLFVDLDNDGDQDLVVAIAMGLAILSNDGQGRFTPRSAKLIPEGMPYSLAAADYDEDGDLDVYVCCYSKRKAGLTHRFLGRPIPYHDANNGARNVLFRNDLDWRFRDVTKSVGLSQDNQRFSFAASWDDYDNDGDLDLYVANDYGRNNLFQNDGGKFINVAAQAGVEDMSAGMSVSWGDVDNNGWMDLYVSNMFSSAGNRVAYQRQFQAQADAQTRAGFQRHARGNSLFANRGGGAFRDISVPAGVTMGRWAWGSALADLNHDGRKDIVVANGFLTQESPDDL